MQRLWPLLLFALVAMAGVLWWQGAYRSPPRAAPPRTAAAPAGPAPAASASATEETGDPRAALAAALAQRDTLVRQRQFTFALLRWMERDLEGALAYVRQMEGPERSRAVVMVLDALGRRDPERALAVARELVATREERMFYSEFFDRLAREDPAAAVQRLPLVAAGPGRENALRAVADQWQRRDVNAALAWAHGLPDAGERAVAMESVLFGMAEADPLRAIELAQKNLQGKGLEGIVSRALGKLTETDVQGAASLVALLPAGWLQSTAASRVARAMAAPNPAAALAWAATLPPSAQLPARSGVLTEWAARDVTAAARYVTELSSSPENEILATQVAESFGARMPQQAIAWAQTLPADGIRPKALTSIVSGWAQHEPAEAAQWAAQQPATTLPRAGLNAALSYWMLRDEPAVLEFVGRLPAAAQTAAAEFVAPLSAQVDPGATLRWAQALPQAASRDVALAAAFRRWLDNDAPAARAWLATASLPPEQKARLLPPGR